MKRKIIGILALIFSLFILTGCGKGDYTPYKDGMNKGNQYNALMGTSYFESQAETNKEIITKLGDNQTAIVLFGILQAQSNVKIVALLKANVLVKPTTGMDVADNLVGNTIPTLIKFGAGYLLGKDIVEGLSGAGAITLAGTGNNNYLNSFNPGAANDFSTTFLPLEPELEAAILDPDSIIGE